MQTDLADITEHFLQQRPHRKASADEGTQPTRSGIQFPARIRRPSTALVLSSCPENTTRRRSVSFGSADPRSAITMAASMSTPAAISVSNVDEKTPHPPPQINTHKPHIRHHFTMRSLHNDLNVSSDSEDSRQRSRTFVNSPGRKHLPAYLADC